MKNVYILKNKQNLFLLLIWIPLYAFAVPQGWHFMSFLYSFLSLFLFWVALGLFFFHLFDKHFVYVTWTPQDKIQLGNFNEIWEVGRENQEAFEESACISHCVAAAEIKFWLILFTTSSKWLYWPLIVSSFLIRARGQRSKRPGRYGQGTWWGENREGLLMCYKWHVHARYLTTVRSYFIPLGSLKLITLSSGEMTQRWSSQFH